MPIGLAAGAAAIGVGGAILSSKAQKKAANKASDVALQTATQNNALAREIYGKNQQNLSPFMNNGVTAGNALAGEAAKGPQYAPLQSQFINSALNPGSFTDFRDSTGYNFRLNQGIDALNTGWGAKGALQSGAAMKDITRYGQDYASNEYQKYISQLDRYASYSDAWNTGERGYATDQRNNWLGLLSNQQGVGLAGASALAGVGQNYVNTVSANNDSAGQAAAAAAIARGYANSNMWSGIAGAAGSALTGGGFGGGGGTYGMYPYGGALGM